MEVPTATAIELTDLELSAHACDRYVERIRPALEREVGARELARLIWEQGRLVADPPSWLAERQRAEPADAYVLVGDDGELVLPVRKSGGRFPVAVAVTCLDRTGVSELARQGRNRRRRERAARRRQARAGGTQPRRRR